MIRWFAHMIQRPHIQAMVALVIKSDKQGCGKGLIIDQLFGEFIFGERSYTQIKKYDYIVRKI